MKEMKEKKDKDKSKSRKDKATESSGGGLELASELNWAVISLPKFLEDFPAIITALDGGEYVDVNNISNELFRNALNRILRHLPANFHPSLGWYKRDQTTSVSGSVLKILLDVSAIKQPSEIDAAERIACQQAPLLLMNILAQFPDLKHDFPSLISSMLDGNAVQLDDIENEDVRYGLQKLFQCLELADGRDGFAVPVGKKQAVVQSSLKHILKSLNSSNAFGKRLKSSAQKKDSSEKKKKKESKKKSKHSRRYSSSSSDSGSGDSSSSSSNEDSSSGDEGDKPSYHSSGGRDHFLDSVDVAEVPSSSSGSAPRVGPTMPSEHELTLAQRANEQYRLNADEEEDEEDFGPQMFDPAVERAKRSAALGSVEAARLLRIQQQPLGFIEQAVLEVDQPVNKYQERYGEYVEVDEEAAALAASRATEREEWILDPGQNKLIGDLKGIGTKNRQFQSGRAATKIAQQLSNAKSAAAAEEPETEESVRTKAIMAEFREKRGLTLMEQHLEKQKEGKAGSGAKRKAFDRDRDMSSMISMDKFQVQKMVSDARELDNRFDKGSVQKSFL